MTVNMLPAYFLAAVFIIATGHLAAECVLGVVRYIRRRNAKPVATYGVLWPNGVIDDITSRDYDALVAQGYDELDCAYWDAWVEDALRMAHDTPIHDRLICEQYEREFRGEGK